MTFARSPYTGPSSGLVLAIDIGTTYSGVSYALLDPGNVPEIKSIGRLSITPPVSFVFRRVELTMQISGQLQDRKLQDTVCHVLR